MPSIAEDALTAAIAEAPEALAPRLLYADWLEDQGDPRAEYLRLRGAILDPKTEAGAKAEAKRKAKRLAKSIDPAWLRFVETQDRLYQISRRCGGGPLPLALRVLWREAAAQHADPADDDWQRVVVPGSGSHGAVALETTRECKAERDEYLEDDELKPAFVRMFKEIDFLGSDDTGAVFGWWRYAEGVTATDAPVVYLDANADFTVTGATLQDHFAVPDLYRLGKLWTWTDEDRARFEQVRAWFAARGVETSPSPEALGESLQRFPNPAERFAQFVEECE